MNPSGFYVDPFFQPEAVKKKRAIHAISNGGSGMPLTGIGECTLCQGIA